MQLSFSAPTDSNLSPLLTGVAPDPAAAALGSAAGAPDGFAQLLAGIGSPMPLTGGAMPADANVAFGAQTNAEAPSAGPTLLPLLAPNGTGSSIIPSMLGLGSAAASDVRSMTASDPASIVALTTGVVDVSGPQNAANVGDPGKTNPSGPASAKKPLADDGNLQALVCAMSETSVPTPGAPPTDETPKAFNGEPALVAGTLYRGIDLRTPPAMRRAANIATSAEPIVSEDSGSSTVVIQPDGQPEAGATASLARAAAKFEMPKGTPAVLSEAAKLPLPAPTAGLSSSPLEQPESPTDSVQPVAAADPTLLPDANPTTTPPAVEPLIGAKASGGQDNKVVLPQLLNAAEKFAADLDTVSTRAKGGLRSLAKSFLGTSDKEVTKSEPTFGISVAGSSATMPAGSTLARSNTPDPVAAIAAAPSGEARADTGTLPPPVALTSTAHRAVETVLEVTERFAGREQHAVNLQFSVAGADLKVRVELRAGEVHTTFRTDSAELRTALSTEWQSVTTQPNAERSTRLAPPVFTSNDAGNNSLTGDGASRQRDQQQARPGSQGFAPPSMPRRGSSTPDLGLSAASTIIRTVSGNSVHLHTLA